MNYSRRFCLALTAAACMASSLPLAASTPDSRPPNVIIIFTDDQGYNDVGCFGSPLIRTPNLDRMAAEGMRFTDFYASSPVCTPSRASLLTGCYAQRVDMCEFPRNRGTATTLRRVLHQYSKSGLADEETTIAEMLKSAGYSTAIVGKWHLGHQPEFLPMKHGFDYWYGLPYSNDMPPVPLMRNGEVIEDPIVQETLTKRYTEEAQKFIRSNQDEPFFLYLAHSMPHAPIHASETFRGKSGRGLYGDVVEEIDWSVGEVLKTLREEGLEEKTLVVFASDNGPWYEQGENGGSASPLRGSKGSTYEGGMRVPCIMRWPGRIPANTTCSEVATTMDLLPTVAALSGANLPAKKIDGRDITPLLEAHPGAKSPHGAFFFYSEHELHAVRSGPWKYRRDTHITSEDIYENRLRGQEATIPDALYHLPTDPGEQKNLMKDHPEVVERLKKELERMRAELGDSLTQTPGTEIRPRGGQLNNP